MLLLWAPQEGHRCRIAHGAHLPSLLQRIDVEVSDSASLNEFIENFDKPDCLSAVMDEKHESDEYVCGTWASEKGCPSFAGTAT